MKNKPIKLNSFYVPTPKQRQSITTHKLFFSTLRTYSSYPSFHFNDYFFTLIGDIHRCKRFVLYPQEHLGR